MDIEEGTIHSCGHTSFYSSNYSYLIVSQLSSCLCHIGQEVIYVVCGWIELELSPSLKELQLGPALGGEPFDEKLL